MSDNDRAQLEQDLAEIGTVIPFRERVKGGPLQPVQKGLGAEVWAALVARDAAIRGGVDPGLANHGLAYVLQQEWPKRGSPRPFVCEQCEDCGWQTRFCPEQPCASMNDRLCEGGLGHSYVVECPCRALNARWQHVHGREQSPEDGIGRAAATTSRRRT